MPEEIQQRDILSNSSNLNKLEKQTLVVGIQESTKHMALAIFILKTKRLREATHIH